MYETCRSMRAKIRAALKKDGITKPAFARACGERNTDRLSRFLEKKGVMSQNVNPVFYKSYAHLEKIRVRDGQDKSAFRKEMEEVHGDKGVVTKVNMDGGFWMEASEVMNIDKYGVLTFTKRYLDADMDSERSHLHCNFFFAMIPVCQMSNLI